MLNRNHIGALASVLALSACASIIEGANDPINITTSPAVPVRCTLTSGRESITSIVPSTVTVKKSRTDIAVDCADPATGAKGQTKIVSDIEPWVFGNIIFGGLIGLGIDWGTGAAYNYPASAMVPLVVPPPPPAIALPEAPLAPQPLVTPASPSLTITPAPAVAPAPAIAK